MVAKKDRTGEENYNNFGSKMIICDYKNNTNINVYFPEYDWICYNTQYQLFQRGAVKCPYEPRVFGKGYLGEGKYKVEENGKLTKYYNTWRGMLERCYDSKYQEKEPTYKGCEVENYLLNFQNAAEFFESIYYEVSGEKMCLDKDILIKGNKIYSRDTCVFVPQRINSLFIDQKKRRGECPKGVYYNKIDNVYIAWCGDNNGNKIYLGRYFNREEAFYAYKRTKEKVIKQVADEYKDLIPERLYIAMYNYKVEIND